MLCSQTNGLSSGQIHESTTRKQRVVALQGMSYCIWRKKETELLFEFVTTVPSSGVCTFPAQGCHGNKEKALLENLLSGKLESSFSERGQTSTQALLHIQ